MSQQEKSQDARPILVIGYGNLLRSDDGAGPRAAEAVAGWGLPGVQCLALHQLTPELAEPLASSRLAVFVDARVASCGDTTRVKPIGPRGDDATGHLSSPLAVLSLAISAFGGGPESWMVSIPATDLGLGERLSSTAARGLDDAIAVIGRLLGERGVTRPAPVGTSRLGRNMHEVSLMQEAMEVALEQASRQGAERIHRIVLRVGALSGVVPEALEFAFDVVTRGTIAEGARLDLETVPILCSCPDCGLVFHPDSLGDACPSCGRPGARLVGGRELELALLEVS